MKRSLQIKTDLEKILETDNLQLYYETYSSFSNIFSDSSVFTCVDELEVNGISVLQTGSLFAADRYFKERGILLLLTSSQIELSSDKSAGLGFGVLVLSAEQKNNPARILAEIYSFI